MYRDERDTAKDTVATVNGIGTGTGLGPLLVSLQLTDSAFPSGFYTLSHSLEGFAQAGAVDSGSLPLLLEDLLLHGVGPADATALALAHRATAAGDPAAVVRIDEHLLATKLGREMRQAATRTGRQLLDLGQEVYGRPEIGDYFDRVVRSEAPERRRWPQESSTRRRAFRSGRPSPRTCSPSASASRAPRCGCG